jgi:hydrogenase maturation protease
MRILIAGIGNIFFGDDAFGCEVVRELYKRALPECVRVVDFGIRSYDLAYALSDNYDAIILVDAVPRGQKPGTVYLIEPELEQSYSCDTEIVNAHNMNPLRVLQMAQSLGGAASRLYIVGCEPAALQAEELGLSETVKAAVPQAIELIENMVGELLENAGRVPA